MVESNDDIAGTSSSPVAEIRVDFFGLFTKLKNIEVLWRPLQFDADRFMYLFSDTYCSHPERGTMLFSF